MAQRKNSGVELDEALRQYFCKICKTDVYLTKRQTNNKTSTHQAEDSHRKTMALDVD